MGKKLSILLLVVLYLGVSTGATLHFQYCMGRLVKVSIAQHHEMICHKCGMPKKSAGNKKCCSDQHQQLKTDQSSQLVKATLNFSAPVVLVGHTGYLNSLVYKYTAPGPQPVSQAPPYAPAVPAFIRNCTFRI